MMVDPAVRTRYSVEDRNFLHVSYSAAMYASETGYRKKKIKINGKNMSIFMIASDKSNEKGNRRDGMDNAAAIYQRFLNGDQDAFEEIIDLYRENLIFFLHRFINNLDTAEDLAEDVFVEVLVHPDRFKGKSSLKTYLFAIARNKAVDWIRHHSRLNIVSLDAAENLAEAATVEEAVLKSDEQRKLADAMESIKEDYKVALHLVYLEEMSYDEAGKIMKKTRKQVENLVYRGKKALKMVLEEEGF